MKTSDGAGVYCKLLFDKIIGSNCQLCYRFRVTATPGGGWLTFSNVNMDWGKGQPFLPRENGSV